MLHHVLAHEPVVYLSLGFCELLEQELLLDDGVPYYQPNTVTYPSTQHRLSIQLCSRQIGTIMAL